MFAPPAFLMQAPLLRRLIPSALRRYARLFKHRYSIERRMGALFLLDQKNAVDRNLLIKGAWEPDQVETLLDGIKTNHRMGEKTIFLDIGSLAALYSIMVAQQGVAGRIIAFEPEPGNQAQLRANLLLNGLLDRIEVMGVAVSDRVGKIPFFVAKASNKGTSRMTATDMHLIEREIEVDTLPIDDIIDVAGQFVVAKIDVEGSELTVLAGMEKLISNNRCFFQIESFDDKSSELKAWLAAKGFVHLKTVEFDHYFLKDA